MAKKATKKKTVNFEGKSHSFDVNVFPSTGHVSYSGFGFHVEKTRRTERRDRKLEVKRMKFNDFE
jgi:hypothetical protein